MVGVQAVPNIVMGGIRIRRLRDRLGSQLDPIEGIRSVLAELGRQRRAGVRRLRIAICSCVPSYQL